MKTIILGSLLFSFGAIAETCFVRNVEVRSNSVSLAREICIRNIDVKLDVFGTSSAVINYSLDGVAKNRKVSLTNPKKRDDGKVSFNVWSIDSSVVGGGCGHTVEANADATLIMERDGSNPAVAAIDAKITESNDNCHSSGRVTQSFSYEVL